MNTIRYRAVVRAAVELLRHEPPITESYAMTLRLFRGRRLMSVARESMEVNCLSFAPRGERLRLQILAMAFANACKTIHFARGCGTPSLRAFRYTLPHTDLRHRPRAPSVQNSLNPERHNHFAPRRAKLRAIRPQLLQSPELPIIERFRTDPAANPSPPIGVHPVSRAKTSSVSSLTSDL
jgi:hypothetical protein